MTNYWWRRVAQDDKLWVGTKSSWFELSQQGDDFGGGFACVEAEQGVGDGEVEAAGAAASGVEVEDALAVLDAWLVGVAVEDDAEAGGLGLDVEVGKVVEHVDEAAAELEGFGGGEVGAGAVAVDVAANGGDGSNVAEGFEDVGVADVAGVEDVVDAREEREKLWAEEAVGVGEDG
jgi:hypothetical protein